MYSSQHSYGSPPPELSNNPFIDHPANAMARFPDITGSDSPTSSQYTSWLNGPSTSSLNTTSSMYGAPGPMSPQGYGVGGAYPQATGGGQQWGGSGFVQQQPQQTGYGAAPSFSQAPQPQRQMSMSGMPFQPSSAFGQQLQAHVNGGGYSGGPQPQAQAQQQYGGYQQGQQAYGQGYQQQGFQGQQQQYLQDFDPYSAQGQGAAGGVQSPGAGGAPGYRSLHPREYVQGHKAELESWDSYSWKQVSAGRVLPFSRSCVHGEADRYTGAGAELL